MFSSKLKRPLLALAVTAGLLAVAGPASAATSRPPSLAGDGNDVLIETAKIWNNGDGTDTAVKGVITWNPGEGTDVVAGPTSAEVVTNNNDPDRLKAPKSFFLDIGTTETLDLNTAASHHEITHESVTLAVNGRSVDAPFDLSIASSEVFELNTMGGDDSVEVWAPGDGSDF